MRKTMIIVWTIVLSNCAALLSAQTTPWISAYYAGWSQGWYNNGVLPSHSIDYDAVTHIIHFGLVPNADGTVNSDANSILKTNSDSLITAAHAAGKKVLICVGGWGTDREFRSATSLLLRPVFIEHLVSFMLQRGYDGIDIDWEVLEFADLVQYTAFIIELRARLDAISPRPILTAVTSWQAPIFALIHDKLDQINLMTYDLSGAWPGWVSWHNAPVYEGGYRFASTGRLIPSADNMIDEFILGGVPKSKLGIGIDFYGYIWSGGTGTATGGVTEPRQSWLMPPQIRVNVPYYSLIQEQYHPGTYRWDTSAQASYLSIDMPGSSEDRFVTYDNEMAVRKKMEYVTVKGIGGVIIWELGGGMLPARYANRDRLIQAVKKSRTGTPLPPKRPDSVITPRNFTRGVPLNMRLQWKPSQDASWYRLQISYDSTFSHLLVDQPWIIDPWYSPQTFAPETTMYWRVQSTDAFGASEWTPPSVFGTAVDSLAPASWQYITNTGENAVVVVPSTVVPAVGKRLLRSGDLIGVFYRQNGALVCVGYAEWEPGKNTAITVWGNNSITPVKDGCNPGDTLYFKFWERSIRAENIAVSTIASGRPTYTKDGIIVLQTLAAPSDDKQLIPLNAGWNMISSFIDPNNKAVESVTADISGNLVLMKDNRGKVFIPDSGINTIGWWNQNEGYQVFLQKADTMIVQGETMEPQSSSIPLSAGWNLAAYFRNSPLNPADALASIGRNLLLVKDNEGKIYWPAYGISTLTEMKPGQGYKINVTANINLTYPANTPSPDAASGALADAGSIRSAAVMEFYPAIAGTGNCAVLLLQSSRLIEGDEVAVWSGDNSIIGTGKVQNGKCILVLWGKDSLLRESGGAEEGELVRMTIWNKTLNREMRLVCSSLKDGITQRSIPPVLRYQTESVLIGSTAAIPYSHILDQNFPNPFNASTTIMYGIAEQTHVRLELFNAAGQRVALLRNGIQEPGEYSVTFNAAGTSGRLASGVYYCRLQAGDFSGVIKMLMVK